jgi:hypothetical protein
MRRCDIFPSALLFLSILLGGVSLLFAVALLNDVRLGCPLWAGVLVMPCICGLLGSLFVALFSLGFYVAQRQPRDLVTLCVSSASLFLMGMDLLLWMSYPFPNTFPMP